LPAIRAIADYTRGIEARSDMILCATFAQVLTAWRAGQMALTFDIEGMGAPNGDVSIVELYYWSCPGLVDSFSSSSSLFFCSDPSRDGLAALRAARL
jgi:hypothetical protein